MTRVKIISGANLKTGDTDPDLKVQIIKDNGNPKDLSSGSPTVSFHLKEAGADSLKVDDDTNGNVTIDDAAQGKVSYSWQAGDTDVSGSFIAEFEAVVSGETTTFPNDSNFSVVITEALG